MDFVIVGGGGYGCGVAWELAKRDAEVLVLEAREVACGASGGLGQRGVRANGRDRRELPIMRMAYELWPTLSEQIGAPTGYDRIGNLHLIERERDLDGAPARVWMQEQLGIPTQLLSASEVRAMEPALSEQIRAAIYCPHDGVADHTATTRGLAQAAQRLGAVIREHTSVSSVERIGDRLTAVITSTHERLPVNRGLILLSNTHVPAFLQSELGITLPVWTVWPQIILSARVDPMPVQHLIGHAHRRLAMKAMPDGRVMMSGGWRGRWHPDTGAGEPQDDQVQGNVAEAVAVYPSLADMTVEVANTGRPESSTVDDIPIIDRIPGLTNAWFATGWSGHGWALVPAMSQLLASWVYTGEAPAWLQPFGYDRFR